MNDLPITEKKATCGCAHHDEELPVLDARATMSAQEVADALGISRARVYAIAAGRD